MPTTERKITPETSAGLGIGSNSPSINGHADEASAGRLGVSSNSPSTSGHAQEKDTTVNGNDIDTEKKSIDDDSSSSYYNNDKSFASGARKKINKRKTTTPSKSYPFMGYQILPVNPQHVLFPVMSMNQFGYNQKSTQQSADLLSTTNLYIKGLPCNSSDEKVLEMCQKYGKIVSTKAILDKKTGMCKGYGFVEFQDTSGAQKAVQCLQSMGVHAQFAKKIYEHDHCNLYIRHVPLHFTEKDLEQMFSEFGMILSCRILRDYRGGWSKGVGFVRLDSPEHCQAAIKKFHGTILPGLSETLIIKLADKKVTKCAKKYDILDYMQQSSGYQTNSNNGSLFSPWQQPTNQYYVSPGNISNDYIHGLTSQMNAIQLSSNGGYFYTSHDHHTNSNSVGPTQYTQQPPGWNIRLSHPPPHYYQCY